MVEIRQNVLRPLPALLQRCGSSLRSSLDAIVPHLASHLVDSDYCVRALAAKSLFQLLSVVRSAVAIPALLDRSVLGKSVRVREAVLTLLAHAVKERIPPPGEELPLAISRELAPLTKLIDDSISAVPLAALAVLQQVHACRVASLRALLGPAAAAAGAPRAALRICLARLDEADRGVAPNLPPTNSVFPAPPPPPPAPPSPPPASHSGAVWHESHETHGHHHSSHPAARPERKSLGGGGGGGFAEPSHPGRKSLGGNLERRSLAAPDDEYTQPPSPVRVTSAEEAGRELREMAREMRQPLRQDGVWKERAAAMRRLHGMLLGGAARLPQFAALLHTHMTEPLSLQLKDLRSRCVKLACEVINEAATALGQSFREMAIDLLPTLLRVLRGTVTVITEAADATIRRMLQAVRAEQLLPPVISGLGARDASPLLRERCCQYLELLLRSPSSSRVHEDEVDQIESTLLSVLSDASADVRTAARVAFGAFEGRWPARGNKMRERLPSSTQRMLPSPTKQTGPSTPSGRAAPPKPKTPRSKEKPVAPRIDRQWMAARRASTRKSAAAADRDEIEIFEPKGGPPAPAPAEEARTAGPQDRSPPSVAWDVSTGGKEGIRPGSRPAGRGAAAGGRAGGGRGAAASPRKLPRRVAWNPSTSPTRSPPAGLPAELPVEEPAGLGAGSGMEGSDEGEEFEAGGSISRLSYGGAEGVDGEEAEQEEAEEEGEGLGPEGGEEEWEGEGADGAYGEAEGYDDEGEEEAEEPEYGQEEEEEYEEYEEQQEEEQEQEEQEEEGYGEGAGYGDGYGEEEAEEAAAAEEEEEEAEEEEGYGVGLSPEAVHASAAGRPDTQTPSTRLPVPRPGRTAPPLSATLPAYVPVSAARSPATVAQRGAGLGAPPSGAARGGRGGFGAASTLRAASKRPVTAAVASTPRRHAAGAHPAPRSAGGGGRAEPPARAEPPPRAAATDALLDSARAAEERTRRLQADLMGAQATLVATQAKLAETEAKLGRAEASAAPAQLDEALRRIEQLEAANAALQLTCERRATAEGNLKARERVLEHQKGQLAARERESAARERELERREAEQQAAAERSRAERGKQAKYDSALLGRREEELARAQAEAAESRAECERLAEEARAGEAALAQLESSLATRESSLAAREDELARAQAAAAAGQLELRKSELALKSAQLDATKQRGKQHAAPSPPAAAAPAVQPAKPAPHGQQARGQQPSRQGLSATYPSPSTSSPFRPVASASPYANSPYAASPGSARSPGFAPLAEASGEQPTEVSDLLAACNAYVDNIVTENQRMRSKLLSCRNKITSGH